MNDLEYLYSFTKKIMAKFHAFAYHQHALHTIFHKQKLTPYSTLCPVTLTTRHRYETRRNYKMTLEQLEANQVSMRTDIDSMQAKMDRLLETMLLLAQKEKDAETSA